MSVKSKKLSRSFRFDSTSEENSRVFLYNIKDLKYNHLQITNTKVISKHEEDINFIKENNKLKRPLFCFFRYTNEKENFI